MMSPKPALTRFIPFSASDIVAMCLSDAGAFHDTDSFLFKRVYTLLTRQFELEAMSTVEQLKAAYRRYDPDSDLLQPKFQQTELARQPFEVQLKSLLNQANFEPISEQSIQDSLGDSSLFKVRLKVDFNQYEEVLLFSRGANIREEILPKYFGLGKQSVSFINYDRVFVYIRLRPNDETKQSEVMLRLFQNVPKADLEMLFPDTKVGLRTIDKIAIGVPALVSGVLVVSTKLGGTLIILGSLIGFYLGLHSDRVALDKPTLLALGAGLGAVAGYMWKQFSNFKNRKLKFTQALTSNLYFKLLDTNAGVFYRIADNATEEELKEALLAYFFLIQSQNPVSAEVLDERVEAWFSEYWEYELDFEVDDALGKLARLGLAKMFQAPGHKRGLWQATGMSDAVEALEQSICEKSLAQ